MVQGHRGTYSGRDFRRLMSHQPAWCAGPSHPTANARAPRVSALPRSCTTLPPSCLPACLVCVPITASGDPQHHLLLPCLAPTIPAQSCAAPLLPCSQRPRLPAATSPDRRICTLPRPPAPPLTRRCHSPHGQHFRHVLKRQQPPLRGKQELPVNLLLLLPWPSMLRSRASM